MAEKTYTSKELYEYRKVLVDWKWRGPEVILYIVTALTKGNLERDPLLESKIYKTVFKLREGLKKPQPQDIILYNKDQIRSIQLKLKALHNQIKDVVSKNQQKKDKNNQDTIKHVFQVKKSENNYYGDYKTVEDRAKIKAKLIEIFIKIKQFKSNHVPEDFPSKEFIDKLELAFYEKYYGLPAAEKSYMSDLKTLQQYLQKDKSGKVLINIHNGTFTINQIIQLSMKDWLDDEQLRELEHRNKTHIDDDDADFYRQLRIREMTKSKGQECPRCHNNYLYLIDEKQLRRADEAATIFYECFACGHRYKV